MPTAPWAVPPCPTPCLQIPVRPTSPSELSKGRAFRQRQCRVAVRLHSVLLTCHHALLQILGMTRTRIWRLSAGPEHFGDTDCVRSLSRFAFRAHLDSATMPSSKS